MEKGKVSRKQTIIKNLHKKKIIIKNQYFRFIYEMMYVVYNNDHIHN